MSDRGIESLESLHHDGCVAFGAWPLVRGLQTKRVESSGGLGGMKSHPRKTLLPIPVWEKAIPAINCLRLDTRFNVIRKVK